MATTLRTLLKLPEAKPGQRSTQQEEFVKEFRIRIGRVNSSLQKVAAQAGRSVHKPLDDLRGKVIEAQQKALALIDPADVSKAEPAIKRVLDAVEAVDQKASQAAEAVGADREKWLALEEELEDIIQQAGELEDAGHRKAPILRKVGEAARDRAKDGKFREAVVAVNQLRPKFQQIVSEQQTETAHAEQSADVAAGAAERVATRLTPQRRKEMLKHLTEMSGELDRLLASLN